MRKIKRKRNIVILVVLLVLLVLYSMALRGPMFQDQEYARAVFDVDGKLLSASISKDEQWHFRGKGEISPKYKKALVTYEDKRFYRHIGFDVWAMMRAMRLNIKKGKVVSGGSTISMQTIRLHKKNPKRSLWNKLIEIVLSTRLELKHSKEEILDLYASHAPFGGNVVGIEAACWRYFRKSPANMSWAEASLLAVLPNSPGLIHTERNRVKLKAKRDQLLATLKENGTISDMVYEGALLEEIPRRAQRLPQNAPHFLNFARKCTKESMVYSSIQSELQKKCLLIAEQEGKRLKANFIDNLAILVLDIETKQVIAYVGNLHNTGLDNQEYTDMVQAQRSTGSVLKPFLYASSLDNGLIAEKSFLPDYPISMDGFVTENYNKNHTGLVQANLALQKSLNIPFSYLLQQYGIEKFRLLLQDIKLSGINKSSDYYGIPLILGGAESSLWDMTHAYASMSSILSTYNENDGYYEAYPIYRSSILSEPSASPTKKLLAHPPIFRAENIWLTFQNLKELSRPSAEGEWKQFSSSVPIAWKTGTSNGFKDAWAIGVNKKYAIGVWVGNSDGEGRPGIVGSIAAAPIFFRVVNSLKAHQAFETPIDDLTKMATCAVSGSLAKENCPVDSIFMSSQSSYLAPCPYHKEIITDQAGEFQVFKNCYSGETSKETRLDIPPHIAYYYKQSNLYPTPLSIHPDCKEYEQNNTMKIIYPEPKVQIYQPKIGDEKRNKFVLKAHHTDENAVLHWHLNKAYLGSTQNIHEMSALLDVGKHQLTILDQNGNQDISNFEILQ